MNPDTTIGLLPVKQIVYDGDQNVYWLADANLAADPAVRAQIKYVPPDPTGIDTSGAMNWVDAQAWVKALNDANYLGHSDWQLPATPSSDTSCAVPNGGGGNSFGPDCSGSALGNLFYYGLSHSYPSSVAPGFGRTVSPLQNIPAGLYWTAAPSGSTNATTFNFATQIRGANTTSYNYFHVLPMIVGFIGSAPPSGTGIVAYPDRSTRAARCRSPSPTTGSPA